MNHENKNEQREWKTETQRKEREARIAAMKTADGEKKPIKEKKSVGKILFPVIAVILILAIATWGFFNLGLPQKYFSPLKVGGRSVSAIEYGYFYNSTYRQYAQYVAQGLIPKDATGNMDMNALCGLKDYEEKTWGEYLDDVTQKQIQQIEILNAEAEKKNISLNEENLKKLNDQIDELGKRYGTVTEAENNLIKLFGKGITLENLKKITAKIMLAEQYIQSLPDTIEVAKEDVEKYYQEHEFDFKQASYRSFVFALPKADEQDKNMSPEEIQKKHAESMDKLKESVDLFKNSIHSEEDFIANSKTYAREEDKKIYENPNVTLRSNFIKASITNHDLAEWIFDGKRKAGDVNVFAGTDSYEVVYFISAGRDENLYPSVGRILFNIDVDANNTSPEALEAKKMALDAVVKLAESNLDKITDKESLNAIGKELSEQGEKVQFAWIEAQMTASLEPAAAAWLNDPMRKKGDKTVIKNANGCEIILFGEKASHPAWYQAVESAIKTEKISAEIDEKIKSEENKPVVSTWAMRFVDKLAKNTKTGAEVVAANKATESAKTEESGATSSEMKPSESK